MWQDLIAPSTTDRHCQPICLQITISLSLSLGLKVNYFALHGYARGQCVLILFLWLSLSPIPVLCLSVSTVHFSLGELVSRYEPKMFKEKLHSNPVLRYQINHNGRKWTAETILYQKDEHIPFLFEINLSEWQIP